MATAVTAAGYTDLRQYAAATWTFISIRNGGAEVLRLPLSDSRVTLASNGDANPMTIQVALAGSDSDVNLPFTATGSALFKVASGGSALHIDTFATATLSVDGDTLTVQHHIQIPPIA
jgi:hypothetical protein